MLSKSASEGAPLAHFRVEEHWPCTQSLVTSSQAKDTAQRDSMYQVNELRPVPTGKWYERSKRSTDGTVNKHTCPYDWRTKSFFDNRFKSFMDESSKDLFNLLDI